MIDKLEKSNMFWISLVLLITIFSFLATAKSHKNVKSSSQTQNKLN